MAAGPIPVTYDPFGGTGYRACSILGQGSVATAYEVVRTSDNHSFVAKVMRHELARDPQFLRRMHSEAEILIRLRHPHIVHLVDYDCLLDGRPFLLMERLSGRTLERLLDERLPTIHEVVRWTRQLLSALTAAHALGAVHRDLHLGNLFLHQSAQGSPTLKVLDFGCAKFLAGSPIRRRHASSREGEIFGDPHFVSPEAVWGDRIDGRADVYAAGLVALALLTGEVPFAELLRGRELYLAHAWRALPQPSQLRTDVPQELDRVLGLALLKYPDQRFQSAQEFSDALGRVALEAAETEVA